jgi:hypothetical protein
MKRATAILDLVATVAWGSVVWIFLSSFYFQYSNGYLAHWGKQKLPAYVYLFALIWIGVPIVSFILSLVLPSWLARAGRADSAERAAIILCAIGVPWAVLQWFFLGAG